MAPRLYSTHFAASLLWILSLLIVCFPETAETSNEIQTTSKLNSVTSRMNIKPAIHQQSSRSYSKVKSTLGLPSTNGAHDEPLRSVNLTPAPVELRVVGLFGENGSYPVGKAFRNAAELAVEDINARTDILPGYKLILESINSQCDIAVSMDELYRKIFKDNTTKIMVLGGTCSHVTEQTALASQKYNMLQISYSAVSPRLSGPEFPWFFRVMAPESQLSTVRIQLLKHFHWSLVTILQGPEHLFSSTVEEFRKNLSSNGICLNDTLPFEKDPREAIVKAKENDARIIFVASYEDLARKAVCTAYREKFFGPNVVWIFPAFYDLKWYVPKETHNCTEEEILQVIDGYFTVGNVNMVEDEDDETASAPVGANRTQFLSRFKEKHKRELQPLCMNNSRLKVCDESMAGKHRAPLAYDATWAIALALNRTLTDLGAKYNQSDVLGQFSYENHELGEAILRSMKNTSFTGLSGEIEFTEKGDRIPLIAVKQFRVKDNSTEGNRTVELVTIGTYKNSTMTWIPGQVFWKGGCQPKDRRQTTHVLKPLPRELYVSMCLLSLVGVMISILFLVFNIRNRSNRLIKMSSPNINNLILVGCILVYSTVSVEDIGGQYMDCVCQMHLYLLVMGFSLGYGALFAKTWRVYEIMTASRHFSKVKKDLRDSRLLLTVLSMLLLNLLVLVLWTALDPMTMTAVDIQDAEVREERGVREISQTLVCSCRYKMQFTFGLLGLQALLILFGAFLAFHTRKMTIPELNDSKWVGMCIYNVVVLGALGVILILGTQQTPPVTYVLKSVIAIVGTSVTQCLVFVPKLLAYRRLKRGRSNSNRGILDIRTLCADMGLTSSYSLGSLPGDGDAGLGPRPPTAPPTHSANTLVRSARSLLSRVRSCFSGNTGPADTSTGERENNPGLTDTSLEPCTISRAVSCCSLSDFGTMGDAFQSGDFEAMKRGPRTGCKGYEVGPWIMGHGCCSGKPGHNCGKDEFLGHVLSPCYCGCSPSGVHPQILDHYFQEPYGYCRPLITRSQSTYASANKALHGRCRSPRNPFGSLGACRPGIQQYLDGALSISAQSGRAEFPLRFRQFTVNVHERRVVSCEEGTSADLATSACGQCGTGQLAVLGSHSLLAGMPGCQSMQLGSSAGEV